MAARYGTSCLLLLGVALLGPLRAVDAYVCETILYFSTCGAGAYANYPYSGCCTQDGYCYGMKVKTLCRGQVDYVENGCCSGWGIDNTGGDPLLPPNVTSAPTTAPSVATPASVSSPTVAVGNSSQPNPANPLLVQKATDVVVTSVFGSGRARYACDLVPGTTTFSLVGYVADLYAPSGLVIGSYVASPSVAYPTTPFMDQYFQLNSTGVGNASITGNYKAVHYPSNNATNGGFGSLPQSYYTVSNATGVLSNVTYVTTTQTNGGYLPNSVPCPYEPLKRLLYNWDVPFQANFTFFQSFTPPS